MKNNQELLSSVLKTTQMGQIGIRSVLESEMQPKLRSAIESQLREYDSIESEAHSIAKRRHWHLSEINPSIRFMTDRMTKMKLAFGNVDTQIASMMIRGNTSGIIKQTKNLHHLTSPDAEICGLACKLLETEDNNVSQMREFL